jgi:DNA-binding SARP family transcriptional activator
MGLLRLDVLGAPEVFHDGSRLTFPLRKAQALLLYLAVEGGLHQRRQLDAFLWPDSEPHEARAALRNAIALLRHLLDDPEASPSLCWLLGVSVLKIGASKLDFIQMRI